MLTAIISKTIVNCLMVIFHCRMKLQCGARASVLYLVVSLCAFAEPVNKVPLPVSFGSN